MRAYKHRGCTSVLWTHIGGGPRRSDARSTSPWLDADGVRPPYGTQPRALCPDCKQMVCMSSHSIEPVDGGKFFAPELPRLPEIPVQRKQTLWERFKALFSF